MKQILFSVRLFILGFFCDACVWISTKATERCLAKNKPLNKKLLIKMSNFSHSNIFLWQRLEKRFTQRFSRDDLHRLP